MCITNRLAHRFSPSVYLLNWQCRNGQSIQAQREEFQSQFTLWFNLVIYTMYSELLVYHHSTDLEAIFHFRGTAGFGAPVVGFACVISTAQHLLSSQKKRSSDWPMLQQCNEPSPTSLPSAITYSIKFVVSSLVIVMNMQGVNFFVSQSQKKETLEVDKAWELIGSLVAAGQTGGG